MPISSEKITAFYKKVADLPDRPNQSGVSAAQVKAQIDSSPEELRQSLNGLIDILMSVTAGDSGSENIGSANIAGVTGSTVHAQLSDIKTQLNNATTGSLPDGSITTAKYADNSVTASKLASGSVVSNIGYTPVDRAGDTMNGNLTLPALSVSGITGAVAASRYVGATTSGAPTAGTFAVGDFVLDQTGTIWICVTAGTPGTWSQTGAPEVLVPLWWSSASSTSTSSITPGSLLLAKGQNGATYSSTNTVIRLFTMDSNWSPSQKFAFEATLWGVNGSTATAQMWDITSNAVVSGSAITTTNGSPNVFRSNQFTLTTGHIYGVNIYTSSTSTSTNCTDASLIALF